MVLFWGNTLNKILKSVLLFLCVLAIIQIGNWISISFFAREEWALMGLGAGMYLVIFLCVFAFAKTDKISLKKLGFQKVSNWKSLVLVGGLVGFVAQLTIFCLVAAVSTVFFFEYFGIPIVTPLHTLIPLILISGLLTAIVEEAVFRGYIQRTLTARQGFIRALLITSALFAVTHVSFYAIYLSSVQGALGTVLTVYLIGTLFSLFPLGIFLGYAYQKTGQNLICPISLHATTNALGIFLASYSTYMLNVAMIEHGALILISLVRIAITAIVLLVLLRKIAKVKLSLGSYRRFFDDVFTPKTETRFHIKTAPVTHISSTSKVQADLK